MNAPVNVGADEPYSIAQRLAELDAVIAGQDEVRPGGGWLARAVRDHLLSEIEASKPPTRAEEVAALLTSGMVGAPLLRELWARFGMIGRSDVFVGAALAVTMLDARITLAELDTVLGLSTSEAA